VSAPRSLAGVLACWQVIRLAPAQPRFCSTAQRAQRSVFAHAIPHAPQSSFDRRHQERFATAPTRSKTQPQAHDRAGGLADPAATALGGVVSHQQGEAADTSCAMCPITRSPDQSQSANVFRDTCPNPQLSQDRRQAHSVLPCEVGSAGTRNTTYGSTLPCIESDPQERRGRLRAEAASQIVMISTQRSLRLRPSGLGLE
jgi:hypothetical protein